MEAGNWNSYQDYCNRSSFFKQQEKIDEELARAQALEDKFIEAAVERLGDEVEDQAEEYASEQDNDFFCLSLEEQVDKFEILVKEDK